jgi:hypothetical protein
VLDRRAVREQIIFGGDFPVGQTRQRIAAFDWSETTLGDIENMAGEIVRSTVLLVLKSPLAITTL